LKGYVMKWFLPNLRYHSAICLEGPKNHESSQSGTWSLDGDLNHRALKYEVWLLPTPSWRCATCFLIVCFFYLVGCFVSITLLYYIPASYAVSNGRVTVNYYMRRNYSIVIIAYFKALLQIFHRLKKTMIILSAIAGL
jgi:hypothetical protein